MPETKQLTIDELKAKLEAGEIVIGDTIEVVETSVEKAPEE